MSRQQENANTTKHKSTALWIFDHVFCPWFSIGALCAEYEKKGIITKLFGCTVLAYTAYANVPSLINWVIGDNTHDTQLSGMDAHENDLME